MRARTLILAFLMVATAACKRDRPSDPDAAFWQWFQAHAAQVSTIRRADDPIANQLAAELKRVDDRLTFELSIGGEPRELIVSADGLRAAFPVVKRLTAAAPQISGWRVIAFRPRKDVGRIELGNGVRVGADDLSFQILPTSHKPGLVDVSLYAPGIGTGDESSVMKAGFLMLDAALGEYDVETKLGAITWKPAASKPPSARPFRELPGAVDNWK